MTVRWPEPTCPKCGSTDGFLGTSFAYFVCRQCGREVYWTPDHAHPGSEPDAWQHAIDLSPWGRARREFERGGLFFT